MSRLPFLLPWLRAELLLRAILTTRGDAATWTIVRRQMPRLLAMGVRRRRTGVELSAAARRLRATSASSR